MASLRRRKSSVRKILISMGGVDSQNATGLLLPALTKVELPEGCSVTVILGPKAPNLRKVEELSAVLPFEVEVLVGVNNMAELMCEADLAIGAAGSNSWERCCMGLPSIMVVMAENQRMIAQAMEDRELACVLEIEEEADSLADVIKKFMESRDALSLMSSMSVEIVDGEGSLRVVDELVCC